MKKLALNSLAECNETLEKNKLFSNGKNAKVEHLYETSAKSRWPYENLWGIYLAKPEYSWMALWMAITARAKLKKRQVRYFTPETDRGDYIGRIEIFNPENLELKDILCEEAYLYFFDVNALKVAARLDIAAAKTADEKMEILSRHGFERKTIFKRGKNYNTFARNSNDPLMVDIDEWQAAITGIESLVPDIELVVAQELIVQLSKRIEWSKNEIEEDYIAKISPKR